MQPTSSTRTRPIQPLTLTGVGGILCATSWLSTMASPLGITVPLLTISLIIFVAGNIQTNYRPTPRLDSRLVRRSMNAPWAFLPGRRMTLAEQLAQLSDLHLMGSLNDKEFSDAKKRLITDSHPQAR